MKNMCHFWNGTKYSLQSQQIKKKTSKKSYNWKTTKCSVCKVFVEKGAWKYCPTLYCCKQGNGNHMFYAW